MNASPLASNGPVLARAGLCAVLLLGTAACSTSPSLGGNKGSVSGAAAGDAAQGNNGGLEKCPEALGTISLYEDTNATWYQDLRSNKLTSTVPVLRLMVQQSGCFVVVERGKAMGNMQRERDLQQTGEMRQGSNFGPGQMVSADYTLSPEVQFSGKTGGAAAGLFTGKYSAIGALAGNVSRNEASTTLLLIDNRSGVQISAAEGTAGNFDFGGFGAGFTDGLGATGGAYGKTPQGKVVVAAFADSYNQMVKALRHYKAQTVKGGLGTGGRLKVDGSR
jgi:curli biogenesis system outer membrane secretion channel CsgG